MLPYPFWHQLGVPADTPSSKIAEMCLNQLSLLLAQATTPKDTAAIIIEPVLGEGGYVPAPTELLQGLRDICDKHGILLIIDEVQSGYGRTGKNYFIEYSGVRPDILLTAKVSLGFLHYAPQVPVCTAAGSRRSLFRMTMCRLFCRHSCLPAIPTSPQPD